MHGRELLRPCLARPAVFTPLHLPPPSPPRGERFGWTRIGEDSKQAANDPDRERKRQREGEIERKREYRGYYSKSLFVCGAEAKEESRK